MGTDYQVVSVSQFQKSWNIRQTSWNIRQKVWNYCEIYLEFNSNCCIFDDNKGMIIIWLAGIL